MDSSSLNFLSKELEKLQTVAGIIGTVIVNNNGLTIISKLPRGIDERRFGALAATMYGAMETASTTLGEQLINLTVEFEDSQLIVLNVGQKAIFVSLLELNIDLGLILIEIEESIKKVQSILREG